MSDLPTLVSKVADLWYKTFPPKFKIHYVAQCQKLVVTHQTILGAKLFLTSGTDLPITVVIEEIRSQFPNAIVELTSC